MEFTFIQASAKRLEHPLGTINLVRLAIGTVVHYVYGDHVPTEVSMDFISTVER